MTETHPNLRLFLCHSSGDKAAVRNLYKRLRADGFDPWLDEENLQPGDDWRREITKAVRECDLVLVCLSRDSINKKGFVQREIKYALDAAEERPEHDTFIIPVKLEACDVPVRLSDWQWINLFEERGYQKLLFFLQAKSGRHAVNSPSDHLKGERVDKGSNSRKGLNELLNRRLSIVGVLTIVIGILGGGAYLTISLVNKLMKPTVEHKQIWGYVRDDKDQPIAGARVTLDEFPGTTTDTPSDGSFVLTIPDGKRQSVRVRVVKDGYHPNPCLKNMEFDQGDNLVLLTTFQKQSRLPC